MTKNVNMTSFKLDEDIIGNDEFQRQRHKRGFMKKFCNDALRKAFIIGDEVETKKED